MKRIFDPRNYTKNISCHFRQLNHDLYFVHSTLTFASYTGDQANINGSKIQVAKYVYVDIRFITSKMRDF